MLNITRVRIRNTRSTVALTDWPSLTRMQETRARSPLQGALLGMKAANASHALVNVTERARPRESGGDAAFQIRNRTPS